MSKNIVIQEGGVGKSMSVNKLRTDEVGGGSCLWVPEDETKVMHKTITEEGVYKASELDSVYGYDEVTVDLSRKIKPKRIVENGVYYAEDDEILGYYEVDVNVPSDVHNTRKRITENGTYVADDEGFTGYGEVTVDVPAGRKRDKRITENGIYDPEEESLYGYGKVTVDIKKPQLKTKTIRDNGTYEAQKDDDVYGYSLVNVNVPLPKLKSRRITENGTYIANQEDREYEDAPSDVYGYSQVVVDVPQQGELRNKTIRDNGTYVAADEGLLGYSTINVNVAGGKLGTKSITENGTYAAADDNLYGFRSVSVRVAGSQGSADTQGRPTTSGGITPGGTGSSVIGVNTGGVQWPSADDQNEYAVGVNESGNIVVTKVPSKIGIERPPNKTRYNDGDTIDFTGISVILKSADNSIFKNEDYPTGVIPFSQLVFPVNVAPKPSGDEEEVDDYEGLTPGIVNGGVKFSHDAAYIYHGSDWHKFEASVVTLWWDSQNNVHKIHASDNQSNWRVEYRDGPVYTGSLSSQFTHNGKTVYYYHHAATWPREGTELSVQINVNNPNIGAIAWLMVYGNAKGVKGTAEIPVQWVSPYDGRTFESKFNITVTGGDTSGGSGTESGGTNTGGTGTGSNTGGSGTGSNTGGFGGNDDDFSGSGGSF